MHLMAACLWSRDGLVAGRAAGSLYGLPDCDAAPVEIMTSSTRVTPHSGIVVHQTNWLPWEQISRMRGIPLTSVERTLMSLCASSSPRRAAIYVDQAITRGLTTLAAIDRHLWLTARRGRDGCHLLRELKDERWGLDVVPTTPLETIIFEMLVRHDLQLPKAQVDVCDETGRFVARPDFLYPKEKIVIEGHSRRWHSGFEAVKKDEERFRDLSANGYRIVCVTWADATRNAAGTVALIRRMLEDPSFGTPWRPAEWT